MAIFPTAATLAALLTITVTAQSGPAILGATPPDLSVHRVLNAPKDFAFDWEGQRGKVVILEFFGTWCPPCVHGLPKINEFVRGLDAEKYSWWLVADQKVEDLETFMRDHEVVPPILIDDHSGTTKALSPGQYPLAVVIGPDGRIAARMHPALLTAERLSEVLDGERIESPYVPPEIKPDLRWDREAGVDSTSEDALAQVLLQRSGAIRARTLVDEERGRLVGDGLDLKSLIGLAFDAETRHIELSGIESKQRYRVSVKSVDGHIETARAMLQQFLQTSFASEAKVTSFREERVVLERIPGSEVQPAHDESSRQGGTWNDEGVVDMRGVEMSFLAGLVAAQELGAPFEKGLNLTGLRGQHRIAFRYERGSQESLASALEQLGLRFETREVERHRVRFSK